MAMPPYPMLCYTAGCGRPAAYKVAARWSDGVTSELKTYGLACEECLPAWFQRARERRAVCRLASGESLDAPGIYRIRHGQRDQHLQRLPDLEATCTAPGA
jgi:hypothetical protein